MNFVRIACLITVAVHFSCSVHPTAERAPLPILPRPVDASATPEFFVLNAATRIETASRDSGFRQAVAMASEFLGRAAGSAKAISEPSGAPNAVVFVQSPDVEGLESYRLTVDSLRITVEASAGPGAFYALQSLRQLLPAESEQPHASERSYEIRGARVADSPRYSYRGMHLDVGRHFFPVPFIKKYIDLLAMYKMNTFHWHLTEDQGWRIEIKRYPRLTEVGAWRKETLIGHYSDQPHRYDGTRYGGFYTQDEVREVVRYAHDRFVTIVPEIEMPGHALAALSAYPEFSCTGGPFEPATTWGVFDDVFCAKDSVFTFLEDVLNEVIALFPGKYVHIGGDETPKTRWKACPKCQSVKVREGLQDEFELQSYFIRRIERYLRGHGKQLIGWDEILEGGLAPSATVMSWRGTEGGIAAARQGHDVVMTPLSTCYFNFYQAQSRDEPLAFGEYLPLEKVYAYEPTPAELSSNEAIHILGAQGNLWTEYISDWSVVEYMVLPRAMALAEVLWTPRDRRNFDDFADRMARHVPRLDSLGVRYANHLLDVRAIIGPRDGGVTVAFACRNPRGKIRFTTDGTDPTAGSPVYAGPMDVQRDIHLRAAAFDNGQLVTRVANVDLSMHKAAGKPIALEALPHTTYGSGGRQALVNGVRASDDRFGDGEWIAWNGWDMIATVDLLAPVPIDSVSVRYFSAVNSWIWLPRWMGVFVSENGEDYTRVVKTDVEGHLSPDRTKTVTLALDGRPVRYLRVVAQRYGKIPPGYPGEGNEAWLFADEIFVK